MIAQNDRDRLIIDTMTLNNYLDCSSNTYESLTFFNSSPIPDLKPNDSISFFCSLRFYSLKSQKLQPKITVSFSSFQNISKIQHIARDKYVITKFNYTAPSSSKEAYLHDGSIISCKVEHSSYYGQKLNIDKIKEPEFFIPELECVFRLNVSFEPFIDNSVDIFQNHNELIYTF